jgi:pimeloyl-ACP methyl ester carboxylesterase
MPYVTSDGVRTRYEVEGTGPPLVLHIGFLGSLEDWSRDDTQYTRALRDTYRLILVDPRGQGQSDTPHDIASYAPEARARDVVAVLDELGIERAHFWGYSMGARVGFMLAARHDDRLSSLIAGGANPWWEPPEPEEQQLYRWMANGMEAFVAEWEREIGPLPPGTRERWLAGDAEALRAAMRAPGRSSELLDALPRMTIPVLLYVGTNDNPEPVELAARAIPNCTFVPLEGLNHPEAFRRSDLILPHVTDFLSALG